ncbi:MAG: hypothetical protein IJX66_00890 [Lachnospiraceae bacterium]|nr:hypothetical protein [Lachnospiraceae bacterium]
MTAGIECKETKKLLNIALLCQLLYLGYVCLLNVCRELVIFVTGGMREIDSKVFVDVPYLIGAILTTILVSAWYVIIKDIVNKGKVVNFLHFIILYISFYIAYNTIPNEAYKFQYAYIGKLRFSENGMELYDDSWSYALNFSVIEQLGRCLLVLAFLFMMCTLLICWTKYRYQKNSMYASEIQGEIEKNIVIISRIALFLQFTYLGYICYYNLFKGIILADYSFNRDVHAIFDIPYLLGAILSTVITYHWHKFFCKTVKSENQFAFSHVIVLIVTYVLEMLIIPLIACLIQVVISKFFSERQLFGADYDTDGYATYLLSKEIGMLDIQLYALIVLVCVYVLCWAKKKYATKQVIE